MITCERLKFSYDSHPDQVACQIADLMIADGECVIVCGKMGSGKSTFLRLLNGLIPEYFEGNITGSCICVGCQVGKHTVEEFSMHVGSVFQNPATQFFHQTVKDELVFPCENLGIPHDVITCRLKQVSELFGLEDILNRSLSQLSSGQQQKVAIATAFMQQPKVMVLDEPTANLDADGVAAIRKQIQVLKNAGITVILSEHRLHTVIDLADKILYFDNGKLTHHYTQQSFLMLTEDQRHALGLRTIYVPKIRSSFPNNNHDDLAPVVLKNIQFGDTKQTVMLKSGITGLIGKNGVGKSTFAKMIAGLEKSAHEMIVNHKVLTNKERWAYTGLVLQDVHKQLFCETVEKEILLGVTRTHKFDEIVERLNIKHLLHKHPYTLSGGQQRAVVIANALLSDKKMIIFDEPSGMDYHQMMAFSNLLQELKKDKLILLISHDEELVTTICDDVLEVTATV